MNLPYNWFNKDMEKLKNNRKTWPEWMEKGVQEAIERNNKKDIDRK